MAHIQPARRTDVAGAAGRRVGRRARRAPPLAGRVAEIARAAAALDDERRAADGRSGAWCLLRGGEEEARDLHATHAVDLGRGHLVLDAQLVLRGRGGALASATATSRRRPTSRSRPSRATWPCAGSGNALGPVDAFLAMAAAATGEAELAARHADDALRSVPGVADPAGRAVVARPAGPVRLLAR